MQFCVATKEEIPQLKQMWKKIFKDTEQFTDFAFSLVLEKDIYLVKENNQIATMLMAGTDVYAHGQKGFYIYGVCTAEWARGKGYAGALVNYVYETKIKSEYTFAITKPASESLFEYYKKLGFIHFTNLRELIIDIKRNLWATAKFDTVTASRFKEAREQFKCCEIAHFNNETYQKFAQYIYSEGGSTAVTDKAFCIYFADGDTLRIRELFAKDTDGAIILLQAIRERTGLEKAHITLPANSTLFLGEGKIIPYGSVKGTDKEIYSNLMFD